VDQALSADAENVVMNRVPFYPQEEQECGPASLAMTMAVLNPALQPSDLSAMTLTPEAEGTYKQDMLAAARRLGYAPYRVSSLQEMLRFSEQGHPVLVFENLQLNWAPRWHYAVFLGYNRDDNSVYLHSGTEAYKKLRFRRFAGPWERGGRWAYLILSPSEIPPGASVEEALENALVFEQLNLKAQALELYSAMNDRWPERYEPYVGIANIFADKEPDVAIEALQKAVQRQPREPALYYNLAYLYHRTHKPLLFQRMRSKTLELASDDMKAVYQKKLEFTY
jgi:hypothetical protein